MRQNSSNSMDGVTILIISESTESALYFTKLCEDVLDGFIAIERTLFLCSKLQNSNKTVDGEMK